VVGSRSVEISELRRCLCCQYGRAEFGRVAPIHDVGPRRLRMVVMCWRRSASGFVVAPWCAVGVTRGGRHVLSMIERPSAIGRRYRGALKKLKHVPKF
jgi:hypothetical protein